jgi:hypothetical protein
MKLTKEEKELIQARRAEAALEKKLGRYGQEVRDALGAVERYERYLDDEYEPHPGYDVVCNAAIVLASCIKKVAGL